MLPTQRKQVTSRPQYLIVHVNTAVDVAVDNEISQLAGDAGHVCVEGFGHAYEVRCHVRGEVLHQRLSNIEETRVGGGEGSVSTGV